MSAGKEPPEALALRARPKPVTRLSRKALAVLLGAAALLVLAGAVWALRPPVHFGGPPEPLYSTDRRTAAEGLAALPRDYAEARPAPPQLGPPLPGDLGPAMLNAQAEGRMPSPRGASAAEAERERLRKGGEDALASPLLAKTAGRTAPAPSLGPDVAPLLGGLPPATSGQTRREAFLAAPSDVATVSPHRLQGPASPHSLMAGTMIPAALVSGLNADLPGLVIATVTAPVFDSLSGRALLIPQGARLIGTYDSEVGFGEDRALVVWTRLILPNGRSMVLDRLPATDAQGQAGLADRVDRHWRRLAAGAALSTLVGVGAELAAPERGGDDGVVIVAARGGLQDGASQVGQQLTRRNLEVKPTLTVRPGFRLHVLVSRDLVLEPYAD
ncbi:MAG: TrbI/VirB10 family protein [Phenylobacterium sp.]|uniref:TrbI/VirB10 family protein n=1 Tax=Phenylobacterium sp. TaxID=1871053 RepID=UPI00273466C4|nr:TrbI/VirB10 family protein [Phenylobacterium sp.]MDP3746670.1 TrbI/VirB10 family protein [Phenylobacterium sp.]